MFVQSSYHSPVELITPSRKDGKDVGKLSILFLKTALFFNLAFGACILIQVQVSCHDLVPSDSSNVALM